ncbi:tripartite tricarboxylate transporter substrate binding protein [uncultured Pseudacidovorax sp.]|uniref:Bug family tripartite tricarboxylate transporter substrate binding protein n=1 Tax=uncultured Pseudacidovorax sp. TaxID=679313 RepID=UPI0025CF9580|nr:tripartite tricarboxylate transporter substrate binding protein [uncultured Pseudacidovorax sp.]
MSDSGITRKSFLATLAAAACLGGVPPVLAQERDSRVTRIIVPFGTGGAPDIVARLLANVLGQRTGNTFIVENRAGANGNIGADIVAKAPPDGHTLLLHGPSLAINPSIYKKLPFDTERDLRPVVEVCAAEGMLLVVNAANPARTLADFIAAARRPGAKLAYASPGVGNAFHLAAENFLNVAGVQAVHIPYKGAGEAVTALMAGDVQFLIGSAPSVGPQLQAGRLRALAFAAKRRSADFPNVPTFAESGLAGLEMTLWYGLFAPRGTTDAVIRAVNANVRAALDDPGMRQVLAQQGLVPVGGEPRQLAELLHRDIGLYGTLAKRAGIQPE